MVSIVKTNGANGAYWDVKSVNDSNFPTGFPKGVPDDLDPSDSTPALSATQVIYTFDDPGTRTVFYPACNVGDYAYEESDFTYFLKVTPANGGIPTIFTKHVGQMITMREDQFTGTPTSDWTGLSNVVGTAKIPTCKITEGKVRSIVGGNLPIVIDSHANDPNPNP